MRKIFVIMLLFCFCLGFAFSALDPLDSSEVARSMGIDYYPGDIDISVDVDIDSGFSHVIYAVEEKVPTEFLIIENGSGYVNGNSIKWVQFDNDSGVSSVSMVYRINTNLAPYGEYNFTGEYIIDGMDESTAVVGVASFNLVCEEDWQCGVYSECLLGTQNRTCVDLNGCGTEINKPFETQACTAETPVCGNDEIEALEQCDEGNAITEPCPYGQLSCMICDASCQEVAGETSYYGDGVCDLANGEVPNENYPQDCGYPVISVNYPAGYFIVENTTKFYLYNYTELQNLSNVRFQTRNSQIEYLDVLNISRDLNLTDSVALEQEYILIDSDEIPEFDMRAKLTFYDINMTSPRIYKDVSLCDESVCYDRNFTNGTYSFLVTGFSSYELREGPYCGDFVCNNGETYSSCALDCDEEEEEDNNDNPSKKKKKSSGGGSYVPPVLSCEENFVCDTWSVCSNSEQKRLCRDSNGCLESKYERQQCVDGNSDFDNAVLNTKKIKLMLYDENTKRYKGKFVGTEELIEFEEEVEDYIILVNEDTGKEYLSRVVDDSDGRRLYSVEKIDSELIASGVLEENGLVETSITTSLTKGISDFYNNKLTMTIATVMLVVVLICCVFASVFVIKNIHRKKGYNAILSKGNQGYLEHRFSDDRVDEMKKQVNELKKYVNKQKGKEDVELRGDLVSAGWNIDIIEEVLKFRKR